MTTTPLLFDQKALRKRIDSVYRAMQNRAKPKLWKSGKRRGGVRVPGLESLPFTREELWQHMLDQVGPSGIICPYCVAASRRRPQVITMADCVLDHKVPVRRGGKWTLDNLVCVCAACNNEKGHLSYPFFIGIMSAIMRWDDPSDVSAMLMCMRTHGVTMRLKFQGKDKKKNPPATPSAEPETETRGLALQEPW